MSVFTRRCILAAALSLAAGNIAADHHIADCTANADGMAARVKAILGPRYAAGEAVIEQSFHDLEALLLEAGHCAAMARSNAIATSDREYNIREWHSVNQWLSRLTGVVGLSAGGDAGADWRDEYSLFAEVYEFEP